MIGSIKMLHMGVEWRDPTQKFPKAGSRFAISIDFV